MDKAALLKARLPEDVVDIPGVGTVRVRGLSRAHTLELGHVDRSVPGAFERKLLAFGMVDPELTEDEVAQWQAAAGAGELVAVTEKITELSGLADDAAKDAYRRFESDPDTEFRLRAGGEAGDDGGPAPRGDE